MGCCQVVWSALSVFSGTFVPVCPFGAKLCVLGHCLLCKIVTPSCFCCSQLRAGLRLFGFLISVRVLFHHAAVWCVGVPVDRLSLLIFVCIRFFLAFPSGILCTTSCCTQCFCSCALQFMCHCRAAVHCLCPPALILCKPSLQQYTVPTANSSTFSTFSLSLGTSCHNKNLLKKKKKKKATSCRRTSCTT